MLLRRLKLVNYAGIYNGLGRNEIEIDFTKCIHKIVLIKGDNGSGKSTIENALKPLPDENISFIQGESARKEIEYYDEKTNVIYKITYVHDVAEDLTRKTARGYFFRHNLNTGEVIDLNSNGTISGCRQAVYDELQLDSNYITLTQLSNTNRGIADLRPAERKKYVSEILSTSECYENMYKKFTKLIIALKGKIDSATNKINDIGNIIQLEQMITSYANQISILEADIEKFTAGLNKLRGMLIAKDPDNKLMSEMKSFEDSLAIHQKKCIEEQNIIKAMYKRLPEISGVVPTQELISDLVSKYDELDKHAASLKAISATISQSKETKCAELQEKETRRQSTGLEVSMGELRITIANLKEKKQSIVDKWGSIVKLDNISTSEFISAYEAIKQIVGILNQRVKIYSEQEIIRIKLDVLNQINDIESEIEDIIRDNDRITAAQDKLSILEERPANCNNDTCPFIADALKARYIIDSIKRHPKSLSQLNAEKDELTNILQELELNRTMISIYNVNKRLFCNLNIGLDTYETGMMYLKSNGASILNMINSMIDYVQDIDEYSALNAKIAEITNTYNSLTAQEGYINMLDNDISRLRQQIQSDMDEIARINEEIKQVNAQYSIYYNQAQVFTEIYNHNITLAEHQSNIAYLTDQLQQHKDSIEEIRNINSDIANLEGGIANLKKELEPLREKKSECEYKYKRTIEYNNELTEYKRKYDRIEELRRYCSPTTGIQNMFSQMYFSNIITSANRILSGLFDGMFALMPLVVTKTEFRIPVAVKDGINHDDITSMSSAQIALISMIISISLLSQTSAKLNIIVGDEIDAPFDAENRREFISILYKLMSLVGASQSVLISHNSEIVTNDCDVILLKSSDQFEEGNIIWRYQ